MYIASRTEGIAFGLLLLLCACDDGQAELASDGGETSSETDRDTAADEALSSPESTGPTDRCFTEGCPPAMLPAQPEVPFLADAGDGWLRLIQADWQLAPNSEGYRCVTKTVPEDVYIVAFAPLNPLGTHHTTLAVNTASGTPDGVTVCGVSGGGERRLQGAGAGTKPVSLPPGVAMRVAAGEQLSMNLHLFNAGEGPLTGTSGMLVKTVAASEAPQLAEAVLAGPVSLTIPPGRSAHSGSCTFPKAAKIYAVGPHMHQLGVHMRITAHSSLSGERVLRDGPFDFSHQLVYPVEMVEMAAGDRVSIECTYENTTNRTVYWGDSSLQEMCFASISRFPAAGNGGWTCVN